MRPNLGGKVFDKQRDQKSRGEREFISGDKVHVQNFQREENQNRLMVRPLESKLPCLRHKILVRDQLWKCRVGQMHQTNRTSRSQRRTFSRSPEPLFFKVAHDYRCTHGYVTSLLIISAMKNKVTCFSSKL